MLNPIVVLLAVTLGTRSLETTSTALEPTTTALEMTTKFKERCSISTFQKAFMTEKECQTYIKGRKDASHCAKVYYCYVPCLNNCKEIRDYKCESTLDKKCQYHNQRGEDLVFAFIQITFLVVGSLFIFALIVALITSLSCYGFRCCCFNYLP